MPPCCFPSFLAGLWHWTWHLEEKDGQVAGNVRGCGGITARPPQTLWPLNPTPFKIKFLDRCITWSHCTAFDTRRRMTTPEDLQKLSSGARDAKPEETVRGENPRASTATNVSKQYVYFNVLKANSWSNYGFCVSALNKEVRLCYYRASEGWWSLWRDESTRRLHFNVLFSPCLLPDGLHSGLESIYL